MSCHVVQCHVTTTITLPASSLWSFAIFLAIPVLYHHHSFTWPDLTWPDPFRAHGVAVDDDDDISSLMISFFFSFLFLVFLILQPTSILLLTCSLVPSLHSLHSLRSLLAFLASPVFPAATLLESLFCSSPLYDNGKDLVNPEKAAPAKFHHKEEEEYE